MSKNPSLPAPQDRTEPTPPDEPYFIEVDSGGCERCAGGKTWTVIGPDGVAIGQSWEDEDHAADVADLMNQAFWQGRGDRDPAVEAPARAHQEETTDEK
jgi:hypothetical protein